MMRPLSPRLIGWELTAVLLMGLGGSGLRSVLSLIKGLLADSTLKQQQVTLNTPQATEVWLDTAFQLVGTGVIVAQGALVLYLLTLSAPPQWPQPLAVLSRQLRSWRSYPLGIAIAASIGIPGIGLYLIAYATGLARLVVPSTLDDSLLSVLLLVVNAFGNGFAETMVMVWLINRLLQLGLHNWSAIGAAAVLRGSYHLYQGFGGGVGNLIMGLFFGWLYKRYGVVWPLVIAHWVMDTAVFIGYPFLAPYLGLPSS